MARVHDVFNHGKCELKGVEEDKEAEWNLGSTDQGKVCDQQ
jgi:hypothetical protein